MTVAVAAVDEVTFHRLQPLFHGKCQRLMEQKDHSIHTLLNGAAAAHAIMASKAMNVAFIVGLEIVLGELR